MELREIQKEVGILRHVKYHKSSFKSFNCHVCGKRFIFEPRFTFNRKEDGIKYEYGGDVYVAHNSCLHCSPTKEDFIRHLCDIGFIKESFEEIYKSEIIDLRQIKPETNISKGVYDSFNKIMREKYNPNVEDKHIKIIPSRMDYYVKNKHNKFSDNIIDKIKKEIKILDEKILNEKNIKNRIKYGILKIELINYIKPKISDVMNKDLYLGYQPTTEVDICIPPISGTDMHSYDSRQSKPNIYIPPKKYPLDIVLEKISKLSPSEYEEFIQKDMEFKTQGWKPYDQLTDIEKLVRDFYGSKGGIDSY